MINIDNAIYLANLYQNNVSLNYFDIINLLHFILHSKDFDSIQIATIAFSKNTIYKGFENNSPINKYKIHGCFHPDDIEIFVFYFKWSMNPDALMLRKISNTFEVKTDNELDTLSFEI